MGTPLSVTNLDRTKLQAMDVALDTALANGVQDGTLAKFIAEMTGYETVLSSADQLKAREFLTTAAAAMFAAGITSSSGGGSVTSVGTGNGLSGGPITGTGTVDLRLNAGGGLTKTLGGGSNELGVDTAVVATTSNTLELASKTLTAMVVKNGLTATGSAANDLSGSTGTFKTSTGAVSLSGNTTVVTGKTLALADMTAGSLLFAGASGLVSQDNANLFWDDTANRLGLGVNTNVGLSGGTTDVPGVLLHLLQAATHAFAMIESRGASDDAGLALFTTTLANDAAIWLDESDSQKLKISLGAVNTHSDRVTSTAAILTQAGDFILGTGGATPFYWHNANKYLRIQQNGPDPADGTGALTIQNLSSSSVAQITWVDHAGTFKAALGLANAGGTGPNYFYMDNGGAGLNFQGPGGLSAQLYAGAANQAGLQLWNGGSLAASAASTGRLTYNSSGQKFQASLNGAGYGDVLAGLGLTFSPSNIRVGIGTAASSPAYALDIRDASSGGECIGVRSLSASGYSDLVWFDSSNVQKGGIGFGNAGVGNTLASRNFFYTPGLDWVMSDGTTDYFRWYTGSSLVGFELADGGSASVSAANKGKLRYNTGAQQVEISKNTGAYERVYSGARANASDTQLTTTSPTAIATLTPAAQGNHVVYLYYRVVTGATVVTLTLTYTDGSGAQTQIVVNAVSTGTGSYPLAPIFINATAAAITVTATAGTANQLFVSANIQST